MLGAVSGFGINCEYINLHLKFSEIVQIITKIMLKVKKIVVTSYFDNGTPIAILLIGYWSWTCTS